MENFLPMLQQIFQVCVIPLLGILTTYLVKYIQKKTANVIAKTDSEMTAKYLSMLSDTIQSCVVATNQTYVNNLKEKDCFDANAQKEAFNKTLNAVLAVLSDDATDYLKNIYGDLNAYITNQIEATVNRNR